MGGSFIDDDWEIASYAEEKEFTKSPNVMNNLVLLGKTGNGKSATGNSILGKEIFTSKPSPFGVTYNCEVQSTLLSDGRILNVIDTPGLFDSSEEPEEIVEEIFRCISLAKDGINAMLMVFSIRSRFSVEEMSAINTMRAIFGDRVLDYMIVVFTNGDDLESNGITLDDYIDHKKNTSLKKFLESCKNRVVLFDNKTTDQEKRARQVQQMLSLVDSVIESNGGQPFSHELLDVLQEGAVDLHEKEKDLESKGYSEERKAQSKKEMYKEQMARINEVVEERVKESIVELEKRLAEEQAARTKAQKSTLEARRASREEIRKLKESMNRARKEAEELRKFAENSNKCTIL